MGAPAGSRDTAVPGVGFRIAGVPVRVEVTFVLMALLLGQSRPGWWLLGFCLLVFVSILVHELGHAVALRAFGDTPRITLWAFGGLTYPTRRLTTGRGVVVSLAGSATQLVALGLPAYVMRNVFVPTTLAQIRWWLLLDDLVWVSVGWALLNLLPILPLDGGQAVRQVLGHRAGRRGEVAAVLISIVFAATGALWAFTTRRTGLGIYALLFLGWNALSLIRERDERSREILAEGRRRWGDDRVEAEALFADAMRTARSHAAWADAGEALAWSMIHGGRISDARRMAEGLREDPDDPSALRPALELFEGDRVDEAAATIAAWWLRDPKHILDTAVVPELERRGVLPGFLELLLGHPGPHAVELAAATQEILHFAGRYGSAAEVGRRLLEDPRAPASLVAYNIACSTAREGHLGWALDWLDRSVEAGFTNVEQLTSDEDLTDLRSLPRFGVILERARRRTPVTEPPPDPPPVPRDGASS